MDLFSLLIFLDQNNSTIILYTFVSSLFFRYFKTDSVIRLILYLHVFDKYWQTYRWLNHIMRIILCRHNWDRYFCNPLTLNFLKSVLMGSTTLPGSTPDTKNRQLHSSHVDTKQLISGVLNFWHPVVRGLKSPGPWCQPPYIHMKDQTLYKISPLPNPYWVHVI